MRICLVALTAITVNTGVAAADDVRMKDLPQAVRTTVEQEAKGAVVEDIERETKNGTVYYELEIERDNQEWKLLIDGSGKVIERKRDT